MTSGTGRALAVVRCGDKSLHENWATGSKQFDVAVSYFGDDATRSFPEAAYVHRVKGGKWDGIFGFFDAFPATKLEYDYFWFPDDDILATAKDVEALIAVGSKYQLELFQPALDTRSYFSHLITLKNSSFELRYTNFVEIMVPMMSRKLFEKALPTMSATRTGFGLDFVWPELAGTLGTGAMNVAIVDRVAVQHTRPVGGTLHQTIKILGGRSAVDELADTVKSTAGSNTSKIGDVAVPRIRVLAARDRDGNLVGRKSMMIAASIDLMIRNRNTVQPVSTLGVLKHALKAVV